MSLFKDTEARKKIAALEARLTTKGKNKASHSPGIFVVDFGRDIDAEYLLDELHRINLLLYATHRALGLTVVHNAESVEVKKAKKSKS